MNKPAKYGYFSQDGKEYIVTRPDTPRPWINYLTNGKFTSLCSATGGGFTFYIDPNLNRITRAYPGETTLNDRPGRYLYIRDNDTGDYWSANWQPVMKTADYWRPELDLVITKSPQLTKKFRPRLLTLFHSMRIWKFGTSVSKTFPIRSVISPLSATSSGFWEAIPRTWQIEILPHFSMMSILMTM